MEGSGRPVVILRPSGLYKCQCRLEAGGTKLHADGKPAVQSCMPTRKSAVQKLHADEDVGGTKLHADEDVGGTKLHADGKSAVQSCMPTTSAVQRTTRRVAGAAEPQLGGLGLWCQYVRDQLLCFGLDALQMVFAFEAFGVDLVHILGSRWACCEPAGFGHHFQATDWFVIAWCRSQFLYDLLAGEIGSFHRIW